MRKADCHMIANINNNLNAKGLKHFSISFLLKNIDEVIFSLY